METIRVLVISDSAADVVLIEELLSKSPRSQTKYYVEAAHDFQSALRALVSDSHDIYLMDYHVPGSGISGIDFIQRAYAGGCILLTQITDETIIWAAEAAGAADVLHKQADLCPHPDCPLHRNEDTPRRLLTRAIRYSVRHFQQLKTIQKQLDAVQRQLADVHRKLNRG